MCSNSAAPSFQITNWSCFICLMWGKSHLCPFFLGWIQFMSLQWWDFGSLADRRFHLLFPTQLAHGSPHLHQLVDWDNDLQEDHWTVMVGKFLWPAPTGQHPPDYMIPASWELKQAAEEHVFSQFSPFLPSPILTFPGVVSSRNLHFLSMVQFASFCSTLLFGWNCHIFIFFPCQKLLPPRQELFFKILYQTLPNFMGTSSLHNSAFSPTSNGVFEGKDPHKKMWNRERDPLQPQQSNTKLPQSL